MRATAAGTRRRKTERVQTRVAAAHGWGQKCIEQSVFAGPLLGLFAQLYGYHLASTAPSLPDPLLHATIRNIAYFHGHVRHFYYTTASQAALFWCLAGPACLWLIGLVGVVCWRGMRLAHRRH